MAKKEKVAVEAQVETEAQVEAPEVNEAEVAARAAYDEAVSAELSEDEVKMKMIGAGATFKNVTRLFNQFQVDSGLAMSKEDREALVIDTLTDIDLSDQESFDECVAILSDRITGATEKSAAAMIRAYGKKNDLEVYKKPKAVGAGKVGFAGGFYAFLIANPKCTAEQAEAFVMGTEGNPVTTSNVQKHKSHYMAIHAMVNTIASA